MPDTLTHILTDSLARKAVSGIGDLRPFASVTDQAFKNTTLATVTHLLPILSLICETRL